MKFLYFAPLARDIVPQRRSSRTAADCADWKTKKAANERRPPSQLSCVECYFSCVEMLPKLVFSLVPMPFTAAIIATEMPAAMRPYSMAVAPDSFFQNRVSS